MKDKFIKAYMYCYDATKRAAEKVYCDCIKNNNIGYIYAIIESLNNDAKNSFYND